MPELVSRPTESFLHSKAGKLVLGLIAGMMIIGGLLMFLKPGPSSTDTAGAPSVEERSVDNRRETTANTTPSPRQPVYNGRSHSAP